MAAVKPTMMPESRVHLGNGRYSIKNEMRTGIKTFAAILCGGISMVALASDQAVQVMDSAPFLSSQFPPAVNGSPDHERAQAVNGNLYAVVAPLYVTPPFLSYLRLFNGGGTTATFTITVVGSGTATAYGSAQYAVPTAATIQLSMSQILVAANAVNRNEADAQFSFYIQSAEPLAGYQHVTLNETGRYFGNASVCRYTIQDVVREASSQMVLPSIHTSRLAAAGYPAQIELHNYANAPVTYRFHIRDEATGTLIDQMDFPTQANASYAIPWSQIENTLGFNPTASQLRANMIVTDPSGAPPAIMLSQTIVNNAVSTSINMTNACAVNKPVGTGGDGAVSPSTCSAPLVTIQTGTDASCGGGNTHMWPLGLPSGSCHAWQSDDTSGRQHNNSASNIQCNGDGTFSFVQFAGNLECRGTGVLKTYKPNTCARDIPPTLFSIPTDLACCSAPESAACKKGLPSTSVPGSKIYLNNELCTQ